MKQALGCLLFLSLLAGLPKEMPAWASASVDARAADETEEYDTVDCIIWYQDGVRAERPQQGAISAEAGIVNELGNDVTLSVFLASYDAYGRLREVQTQKAVMTSESRGIFQTEAIIAESGDRIEVYIWNDMTPVTVRGGLRLCPPDTIREELIAEAYHAIDREFLGVFDWLTEIYDPESGGFYSTVSGARFEGFVPSLEATAFVCQMMTAGESGALGSMPQEIKDKIISFFKTRQHEDGFFYDTGFTTSDYTDRDRIRVYGQCISALKLLGTEPEFSPELQTETAMLLTSEQSNLPEYCSSVSAFMEYIQSLDWDEDSWMAGDRAYEAMSFALLLPESDAYRNALLTWLDERQDPVTGYWAKSGDYGFNAVSGAFKVSMIYHRFQLCPPRPKTILETIAMTLALDKTEFPNVACYIRNPISTIQIIQKYQPELVSQSYQDKELFMAEKYREYIHTFFQSDGGVSSNAYQSKSKFGGIPAGTELCEGDVDGTRQMWLARKDLDLAFGHSPDCSMLEPLYEEFWESLIHKNNVVKQSINSEGMDVTKNFKDLADIQELYAMSWSARAFGGFLEEENGNSFLTLADTSTHMTEEINLHFPRHRTDGTVSCRLKFDRDGEFSSLQNDMSYTYFGLSGAGNSMVEVHGIDSGTGTLTLKVVISNAGGNRYQRLTTVPKGEWFDLEVSHTISDGVCHTKYKVNGIEYPEADGLYTGQECAGIDRLSLVTSRRRTSKISIDDIKITGV